MPLGGGAQQLVVAADHFAGGLGVDDFFERRRPGQVGEQDGHDLAGRPLGGGGSASPSNGEPHPLQNRAVALTVTPHAPQVRSSAVPQPSQKRASASFGVPQAVQARVVMAQSGLSASASLSSMAVAAPSAIV